MGKKQPAVQVTRRKLVNNIVKVLPLSARQVADLLEVSPATLSRWRSGERAVPDDAVGRIVEILNRCADAKDHLSKIFLEIIAFEERFPEWEGLLLCLQRFQERYTRFGPLFDNLDIWAAESRERKALIAHLSKRKKRR